MILPPPGVVLDRCTGEWCLTVDTDEWLDSDFGQLVDFLRGKKRGQYDMASIIQRNYQDKHLRAYGDFFAMRMGRRCGGELRYQGAIHEYLTYRNRETGGCIALQRVILHHDGYFEVDPGKKQGKNYRETCACCGRNWRSARRISGHWGNALIPQKTNVKARIHRPDAGASAPAKGH